MLRSSLDLSAFIDIDASIRRKIGRSKAFLVQDDWKRRMEIFRPVGFVAEPEAHFA